MRCALAAWLVLALILVNLLGAVHRVAHAGSFEQLVMASGGHENHHHGPLFDSHTDLGSCERYDQLSCGGALPAAAGAWAFAVAERVFAPRAKQLAPALRRQAAQARGPPQSV